MSSEIAGASVATVATLFEARARIEPDRIAIIDGWDLRPAGSTAEGRRGSTEGTRERTYGELADRVVRLAAVLAAHGVGTGDRVAVLAENRGEILELLLAAARNGAIVACQSWRLAAPELTHCLALVEPKLAFVSPRQRALFTASGSHVPVVELGDVYEAALANATPTTPPDVDRSGSAGPRSAAEGRRGELIDPEAALVILYTSGTTGLPKGAVISHRAQIARNLVTRAEFAIAPDDAFVAWSPLYHMGAVDNSLGALMTGGTVIVVDGFDVDALCAIVADRALGWLLLMPGMVGRFADELARRGVRPRRIRVCGVMADLVPPAEIAHVTELLGAPYANTFGATETGCPPCSSSLIPIGIAPTSLSKRQSPFCDVRLVDGDDRDVAIGAPGELAIRGPTLFSGYWNAPDVNAHDFRGGWFHMGDVFVRNRDGSLDFVDRVKYLIKTGGENVYPAEIERVMLQDPRVAEVAVVRTRDPKWGEVPIAFVARRDPSLDEATLHALCRAQLAGFKQPKQIRFIALDEFPRSASGKVMRHELEARV